MQIQRPFNLLASIKKGCAPQGAIAQTPTVHKWCAHVSGVTGPMDITEGTTKPAKLQTVMIPDMLALKQLHKPGAILGIPVVMSHSEVKGIWFTDASAKHINGKGKYRVVTKGTS